MALQLLHILPKNVKANLLLSYISKDTDTDRSLTLLQEVLAAPTDFVFPYRSEMVPILEWALTQNDHWKLKYYLAQNYIAIGQHQKGASLLENCGQQPDNDTFYRFRGAILKQNPFEKRLQDYQKALSLNSVPWKSWDDLIRFYYENHKYKEAHGIAEKAYKKFPRNSNIGLSYSKTLVAVERYGKSIAVLKSLNVLPYEHASESKGIYDNAHIFLAQQAIERKQFTKAIGLLSQSKQWPEHLGVGQPYEPDTRLQDYLLAYCHRAMDNFEAAENTLSTIVGYTKKNAGGIGINSLFSLLAFEQLNHSEALKQHLELLEDAGRQNGKAALVVALFKKDLRQQEISKAENYLDDRLWHIMEFVTDNQ